MTDSFKSLGSWLWSWTTGDTAGPLFSVLCPADRSHAPDPVHDPALLPVDSVEDHFLMDAGSYDEVGVAYLNSQFTDVKVNAVSWSVSCFQDSSAALQLQGRAMRSPRRCIPHQQSCLGYPLPCCDPCDTCYCRFFNAICYCRRVGHTCPPRRTWRRTWQWGVEGRRQTETWWYFLLHVG